MSNFFFSDFEHDKEFKQAFAQYEEMKAGKQSCYFDADQLTDFAEYYTQLGQHSKALEVIEYALSIHPANTEVLVVKAHILIEEEKIEEAKEVAYSISESYDFDVKMLKAELFILQNNFDEADALLQEIISQEENYNDDNLLDIAYLYTDVDYHEKALPWFKKAFESNPESNDLRFSLAECYGQCKLIDKGAALYNQLLDKDPYNLEYWFDLGRFYYTAEEYNKALEAYEFALTIEADHPGSILMTAHCYYKLENFEKSCEYYERYEKIDSDSGITIFFIGLCYYYLKNFEKSIINFKKSLDLNNGLSPDTIDIYTYIAMSYEKLKQLDKAIEYIDNAIKEDPSCAEPYLVKGRFYLTNGERDQAIDCFAEAIKINPEDPKTIYEIGTIYFDNKIYDLALKCFETVESSVPGYENNYLSLAYTNAALGNFEVFNEYFLKATKQNPDSIMKSLKFLSENQADLKQLILDLKKLLDDGDELNISNPDYN